MSDLVYHYTPLPTLIRIVADGVVRAHPQTLYRDLWATRVAARTPPVVWLTRNSLGEATTASKLRADGYRGSFVGSLCRVVIRESPDLLELPEYSDSIGLKPGTWKWVLRTADWMGIDPSVWRLCPRDIPREEWVGIEMMAGIDAEGTTWQVMNRRMTGGDWRRASRGSQ